MATAALYLRISKDAERKGLGVDRQRRYCQHLAEQRGWRVVAEFCDNDQSAYQARRRPEFEQLIDAMRAGEFTYVLAYAQDRLARSPSDLEKLIGAAEAGDVKLVTASGELAMDSADGRLRARILGSVASSEVEKSSERIRSALADRTERGEPHTGGARAYGWDRVRTDDGVKLHVNQQEARVVREVADRLLAGDSLRGIADDLNARGLPTAQGHRWTPTRLREVMSAVRLFGGVKHHGQVLPDVEGQWTPLLTRERWDRVQTALAARRSVSERWTQRRRHLLSGLATCGVCGGMVVGSKGSNGRASYRCREKAHLFRSEPRVDEHVVREVAAFAAENPLRLGEVTAPRQQELADRVAEVERRQAELGEQYAAGQVSVAAFTAADRRLTADLEQLREEQVAAFEAGRPRRVQLDFGCWEEMDLDERRQLLELYVERIVIHRAKQAGQFDAASIEIVFRDPQAVSVNLRLDG